ncbi:MAG TPA: hypothetical protein VJ063_09360 [Verrucomicrobiae bacterium]|nr:hypothetical protein [Verrucomicrobiae bacterium]
MSTNPPPDSHTSSDLDAALALASENICQSLLDFDWTKWKQQLKGDSASLKDLIAVLARLSRELLAREKYREELAAQRSDKAKRPPTFDEIKHTENKLNL